MFHININLMDLIVLLRRLAPNHRFASHHVRTVHLTLRVLRLRLRMRHELSVQHLRLSLTLTVITFRLRRLSTRHRVTLLLHLHGGHVLWVLLLQLLLLQLLLTHLLLQIPKLLLGCRRRRGRGRYNH